MRRYRSLGLIVIQPTAYMLPSRLLRLIVAGALGQLRLLYFYD